MNFYPNVGLGNYAGIKESEHCKSGINVVIVPSLPVCLAGYSLYMSMDGFCLLKQKRAILI